MILKWGDKDKMICETCENNSVDRDTFTEVGFLSKCAHNMTQFNPWQKGGGRGCPMWEQRIDVPENQLAQ